MEQKTALYDQHIALNAKMVPFGGFIMPIQYKTGIIAEHLSVRENVGIFDISHMGEFIISGKDALKNLQYIFSNDFSTMEHGDTKYTFLCNNEGGIVDDLLVFYKANGSYLLVVNASNIDKDFDWIKQNLKGEVTLTNDSSDVAAVAIQGPKALELITKICGEKLDLKYYSFLENINIFGVNCLISRTGYTGEDGFELYFPTANSKEIWEGILSDGEDFNIMPCGLGARDTLRFEAGMPLYGHELNDKITPIEAGLKFFVKMDKENFIGKSALEKKLVPSKKRIGLVLKDRGIAREGSLVFSNGKQVGVVTSGTMCPSLKFSAAMAYVDSDAVNDEAEYSIEVRGKQLLAEKVKMPFYKKEK